MRSLGQFILLRIPENYSIRVGGDDGVLREVRIREEGGVDHVVRGEVDEVQFCFSSVHFKISVNYFSTLFN